MSPTGLNSKEFQMPYNLNTNVTKQLIGLVSFAKTHEPNQPPTNDQFYQNDFISNQFTDDLDEVHQPDDSHSNVWEKIWKAPGTAWNKFRKFGVDLIGLGPLYGSNHFDGKSNWVGSARWLVHFGWTQHRSILLCKFWGNANEINKYRSNPMRKINSISEATKNPNRKQQKKYRTKYNYCFDSENSILSDRRTRDRPPGQWGDECCKWAGNEICARGKKRWFVTATVRPINYIIRYAKC